MTEQPPIIETDRIEPVDINLEMQRSYIDYAMTVIVSRALPDVRDGMKPVHRRVVYAMYDGGYRPDRGYNKCSRVVGEVMGQYHPHGDASIYDALVRLVQDWSLRYPLVDGQGNFGSPGDDPAAAPRYTECRMASLAMEMVRDIDQDTVDFGTARPRAPRAHPLGRRGPRWRRGRWSRAASPATQPWPATLPEQVRAVAELLTAAAVAMPLPAIEASFKGKGHCRKTDVDTTNHLATRLDGIEGFASVGRRRHNGDQNHGAHE